MGAFFSGTRRPGEFDLERDSRRYREGRQCEERRRGETEGNSGGGACLFFGEDECWCHAHAAAFTSANLSGSSSGGGAAAAVCFFFLCIVLHVEKMVKLEMRKRGEDIGGFGNWISCGLMAQLIKKGHCFVSNVG